MPKSNSSNPMDHVRTRKRGEKWSYRFEKAKIDGKRQVEDRGGFDSEEDALMAGVKSYELYVNGGRKTAGNPNISFADYLDIWYDRTKLSARNNTLELREKNIRLHIKPALGSYRLNSLTPAAIDDFVKKKRLDGYAYETVNRMLNNISTALDYAIWPMELLHDNPARLIRVPGKEFAPLSNREPRRRIEDSELKKIFQLHPYGTTYHMPLAIGLYFGTRISEALCASWDMCDMDNLTMNFTRQIQRLSMKGHHSFHYVCELKTENSIRGLKFDADIIMPLLKHWKQTQRENEISYGSDYFYNYLIPAKDFQGRSIQKIVSLQKCYPAPGPRIDIICTQPNGKYIKSCSMAYQCKRIRELGVHGFDFHCMRYTSLTMLGESQLSINSIKSRAGHSSYETTQRYVMNRPDMQDAPVAVITKKVEKIL